MRTPTHRAYSVVKREGKEDYWLNLGVVYPHEDGEGYDIHLQALPADTKIVLLPYRETIEEQEKVIRGKRLKK